MFGSGHAGASAGGVILLSGGMQTIFGSSAKGKSDGKSCLLGR